MGRPGIRKADERQELGRSGEKVSGGSRRQKHDLCSGEKEKWGYQILWRHDLLRELSIEESVKEQLLELPKAVELQINNTCARCANCGFRNQRDDGDWHVTKVFSDGNMPLCGSCWSASPSATSRSVLAVEHDSPLLTMCRYIDLYRSDGGVVLNTIRLIWNLEVLVIRNLNLVLPKELWEMPRLTHVTGRSFELPDPGNDVVVLENLQTLDEVFQFMFTEEIVRRIPNLRELHLRYHDQSRRDWPRLYLQNLSRRQKLESLFVSCCVASNIVDINKYNFFPRSLKKLFLCRCGIVGWDSMTIIGSLPNLQVLHLRGDSVLGDEWNPIEGEFPNLRFLDLRSLDLARWNADKTHFPALEDLELAWMDHLETVPDFGGLDTLKSISVCGNFRDSVVDSLRDIFEEQQSNGNEEFAVTELSK